MSVSPEVIDSEYNKLLFEHGVCEKAVKKYQRLLKEFHTLQDSTKNECDNQLKRLKSVKNIVKRSSTLSSAQKKEKLQKIKEMSNEQRSWKTLFPSAGSLLLTMLIGKADIRMLKPADRQNYKMQYNYFRLKYSYCFIFFNLLLLLIRDYFFVDFIWFGVNFYFYFSISLREIILRYNGSHIKRWWIFHHYLCVLFSLGFCVWGRTERYVSLRHLQYFVGAYEGILHYLQARYQIKRIYTLVSMGKASAMDVPNSDSNPQFWTLDMVALLPFLLIGYILQFYLGCTQIALYFGTTIIPPSALIAVKAHTILGSATVSALALFMRRGLWYLLQLFVPFPLNGTVNVFAAIRCALGGPFPAAAAADAGGVASAFFTTAPATACFAVQTRYEWNLLFVGVIFVVMAVGNFLATLSTFISSHGGRQFSYLTEWSALFMYGSDASPQITHPEPQRTIAASLSPAPSFSTDLPCLIPSSSVSPNFTLSASMSHGAAGAGAADAAAAATATTTGGGGGTTDAAGTAGSTSNSPAVSPFLPTSTSSSSSSSSSFSMSSSSFSLQPSSLPFPTLPLPTSNSSKTVKGKKKK